MNKEFVYEYPCTKEQLWAKLKDHKGLFFKFNNSEYIIRIMDENRFFLCVKPCAHSGGLWYVAHIEERKESMILIRGRIVENPDEKGKKRKPNVAVVIFYLLVWPVAIFHGSYRLYLYCKNRKQIAIDNAETIDHLNQFMLDYLGCTEK